MNKKRIIFFLAFFSIFFLIGVYFLFFNIFQSAKIIEASSSCQEHNVWGWAWSENIGWISFSCRNETALGEGVDYGVDINGETGIFSGYAWSEHIGWITFNEDELSGCPSTPCRAEVNLANGEVSGWARAHRPLNPEGQSLGEWTGWIKLRGTATNEDEYGVEINTATGEFSGFAWGGGGQSEKSAVIGWINFQGNNYEVKTDFSFVRSPTAPTLLFETWDDCAFKELSVPTFHWDYSHPDNISQGGYQIKVYGKDTLDTTSDIPSTSYAPLPTWVRDNLLFGEISYSWQVRVKDESGNWSEWSELKSFQTRKHAYPWIDFSWTPRNPSIDETIELIDKSECYGGTTCSYWSWEFPVDCYSCVEPDIDCENVQEPEIKFSKIPEAPDNKIYLKVTDSAGNFCKDSKEIGVMLYLPEWKEVPAF